MQSNPNLITRTLFLEQILKKYATKKDTILEIGSGDNRNVDFLKRQGWNIEGIDRIYHTAIEDIELKKYDVIFTMSTLFLIPEHKEWVFEKIANMAQKYIITFEGETTKGFVIGRNYEEVFSKFGFKQVEYQNNVFNEFGVLRVLCKK